MCGDDLESWVTNIDEVLFDIDYQKERGLEVIAILEVGEPQSMKLTFTENGVFKFNFFVTHVGTYDVSKVMEHVDAFVIELRFELDEKIGIHNQSMAHLITVFDIRRFSYITGDEDHWDNPINIKRPIEDVKKEYEIVKNMKIKRMKQYNTILESFDLRLKELKAEEEKKSKGIE